MEINNSNHLLSSLGVLSSFIIARKISNKDISIITKQLKKTHGKKSKVEFQKLLVDTLIENTKKYVSTQQPPGFIIPPINEKKQKLDAFYSQLAQVSQNLSVELKKQKLTKLQVCFIINALINLMELTETDFENFREKFSRYRENDFGDDDDNNEIK
jgi:hypothetical protein